MNSIGISFHNIFNGEEVYYYSWLKDNGDHSEPIKTKTTSNPFQTSAGNAAIFLEDVSGYVVLTHLSKEYYPEQYTKPDKSKGHYEDYLKSDFSNDFSDYLGIQKPKWEYGR